MHSLGLTFTTLALVLDQLSKHVVLKAFKHQGFPLHIAPFLDFIPAWNRGVSFSLFSASTATAKWLLISLTGGLCLLLYSLLRKAENRQVTMGYGLILGGALGNLVDRVQYGAVFDFIDVHYYTWHFYTFNGADSFITLGVALIMWDYLLSTLHSTR